MLAFTFPGQGSQRPGMGRPWVDHASWELVNEASEITGRDVRALLLDADADELRDTRNAQLTTFVSSLVVLDAVERLGVLPNFCAGHSLGEYTALAATGALGYSDGIGLVTARANAMHDVGNAQPGTMAAVLGLDDDQVDIACNLAQSDVWVANYNAPGQVVIAGSPDGIAAATQHAKDLGAKRVLALEVSGAFHTSYMTPARDRLQAAITATDLRDAETPIISNVDCMPHAEGSDWPDLLSAQLTSPVRWKQGLQTMSSLGVTRFAELGPGKVLTGLAKRSVEGAKTISVSTPDDLDKFLEWVGETPPAPTTTTDVSVEGEHLFAVERVVVAPAAGIFSPAAIEAGTAIAVGDVLGLVGEEEVRSPFNGELQNFIAVNTERVTPRQPIAWLRTD